MKYKHLMRSVAALAVASLVAGCTTPAPKPPASQPVETIMPDNHAAAAAQIADHAKQFDDIIAQMPNSESASHRKLLGDALGELTSILRLANGSDVSPAFANDLSVIDSAQKAVGNPSLPHNRMQAVEDQALHAAAGAFGEIKSRVLFDDDQLGPMIDGVIASADEASTVNGPMHDMNATECFRQIQNVVQRLSADMDERFTNGATPGGETAATPATSPTSAPATMP